MPVSIRVIRSFSRRSERTGQTMILETAVDRFETMATIWFQERFFHVCAHPQGEGRYDPWCTSRAAPGCVTTRCN